MLTFRAPRLPGRTSDDVSRRDFLRIGALGVGGLTLADLLRLKAQGTVRSPSAHKAVIMVYLPGGPSHIDMYDLKPDAPAEYRGEFSPIRTNVPGIDVCELMPRHATHRRQVLHRPRPADARQSRSDRAADRHPCGRLGADRQRSAGPAFGCVVSKLLGGDGPIPPYVSTSNHRLLGSYDDPEEPAYLGPTHRPFSAIGPIMQNLARPADITLERLEDRGALLRTFDSSAARHRQRRPFAGRHGQLPQARPGDDRLDPACATPSTWTANRPHVRSLYGNAGADFLRARRLVEAGVRVVSVAARFSVNIGGSMQRSGRLGHARLQLQAACGPSCRSTTRPSPP